MQTLKILYPHKNIPSYFHPFISPQTIQSPKSNFITGYKSYINNQKKWSLSKDQFQNNCTITFSFPINATYQQISSIIKKQSNQKQQPQLINDCIVITQNLKPIAQKLTQQEIQYLIEAIQSPLLSNSQELSNITFNIFQNSFQSYQAFNQYVGWYIESKRKKQNHLNMPQKIKQEYLLKKIQGKKVFQIPKYNPETGNWDQIQENINLKLHK